MRRSPSVAELLFALLTLTLCAIGASAGRLVHITGDSTTAVVLNLMESMGSAAEWQRRRVRMEHANGIVGADVERARRLGIVIAQP